MRFRYQGKAYEIVVAYKGSWEKSGLVIHAKEIEWDDLAQYDPELDLENSLWREKKPEDGSR